MARSSLTPKFSRMRLDRNLSMASDGMPHGGCNAYVRRSDGGTAPNLVRRYGRLCADGLRGWSARVARRAGARVRVPVYGCLTSMAGDSNRVRAPGPPQRSCRATPSAGPHLVLGCERATVRRRGAWSGGA
jgi:hypothetical protein